MVMSARTISEEILTLDRLSITVRDHTKGRACYVLATGDFARSESTSLSGVLGATDALWNAFHNCSVAPKTPRFTRSGSTTTGTLRFFGTTFKNFKAEDRMKTIALIDTRSEVPGKTLGILVSTHPDMVAAFAGNDAFQKAEGGGRHIRTKILTLKDPLDPGQPVRPTHLAESQMNQTKFE